MSGGWVEDDVYPKATPEQAPVGFVEALPGPSGDPRKWRRKKPKVARLKIGWGSERLNRRSKDTHR